MAFSTFLPTPDHHHKKTTPKRIKRNKQQKQPSSWDQIKSLLTCKQIEGSQVHDPSSKTNNVVGYSKLGSSCSSICNFRDVVHGNTRVVHRADNSPENSSVGQETGSLLTRKSVNIGSSTRSSSSSIRPSSHNNGVGGGGSYSNSSSRGMQLRKLSGCYECHMIVDPSRYPITPRTTICACSECGEVFPKIESLEHHQAIRHAVSELGPEDSGRNIVEIIFKSSWLKKDSPICKIERILKVHNTQRTIQRFEDCRDAVKVRATNNTRKNPRCAADGNELLRFHCTSLTCALGARGSSNLCGSVPGCGVCTIIRHGFPGKAHDCKGVRTTATSGRAHDCFGSTDGSSRRAMLVCRVIAGRVKRIADDAPTEEESVLTGTYDSVAGYEGLFANLEDLTVFNPRAILPCFVVIYKSVV
ncbi:zinc finger protein [Macleaya cordata]|uniref:Zinc finger protein n=1 Tax=Macleaya cordata TaxID=56857 RepID=A0A200Q383_MACCD|nr:zinc finger protein [Macleaya cordata]